MNDEKKYNEALERARKLYEQGTITESLCYVFPELKESEDEKIRKELIDFVKSRLAGFSQCEKMIDWLEKQGNPTGINQSEFDLRLNKLLKQFETLPKEELASSLSFYLNVVQNDGTYKDEEKQGEQKSILPKWRYKKDHTPLLRDSLILNKYMCVAKAPSGAIVSDVWVIDYDELVKLPKEEIENQVEQKPADKVEPKFHEGEWVIYDHRPYQVVELPKEGYINLGLRRNGKIEFAPSTYCKHWTIDDAKEGDVLCYKNEISLYKHDIKNCTKQGTTFGGFVYYCCYDGKRFIVDSLYSLTEQDKMDIHPATKEQRDTLMKAMANAGWKFDFEKKELKKIEPDKDAWSEKDEEIIEALGDYVKNLDILFSEIKIGDKNILSKEFREKVQHWLKSFKDRVQPQPKQELKKIEENNLTDFENAMMHIGESFFGKNAGLDPNDTNAIKEQANLLLELVPSKEWKPLVKHLVALAMTINDEHLDISVRDDLSDLFKQLTAEL